MQRQSNKSAKEKAAKADRQLAKELVSAARIVSTVRRGQYSLRCCGLAQARHEQFEKLENELHAAMYRIEKLEQSIEALSKPVAVSPPKKK